MLTACLALVLVAGSPQDLTVPPSTRMGGHATEIEQLAVSPDGSVLVTSAGHELKAWDLKKGRELWSSTMKFGSVEQLEVGREHVFYSRGLVRDR